MLAEDLGIQTELGWPAELKLALSVVLIVGLLGLRWMIVAEIRRRSDILSDNQRWWMTVVRNSATGLIMLGLIVLWAKEIGDFALSITAFVLALVIATKELLLGLAGAAMRGATLPFRVGDWIEIGEHSGEVIDETLLSTVLQEIDPKELRYTGRTISVPNALLLSREVVNHNFRKRFLIHEFVLTAEPSVDAGRVREAVLDALHREHEEFAEIARRYASVIEKSAGIKLPEIQPRVCLGTTDLGNVTFRCSLFCPRERAMEIEQAAARAFVGAVSVLRGAGARAAE